MSDHLSPTPEETPPNGRRLQHQELASAEAVSKEWVTIGQIVALFGLRGDLKVVPQTDIPDRFSQLRAIYLGPEHRRYRVLKASPYKADMILLRLAGIANPNAAQALIGLTVTVPLAQIAPLPPDQYYIHDLIGLRVESTSGQALGVIADVLATGGNDVYVVREAATRREVLVPAIKEVVKQVDITAGRLVIDPLPGLFDDRFEVAE